jgi:hypothetical protein
MMKSEITLNDEGQKATVFVRHPFVICALPFLRHSSFVIRH